MDTQAPDLLKSILELAHCELHLGQMHLHAHLSVANGITGLFGPSGSGKTTLLEIIAGLRKPSHGKLSIHGKILFDIEAKRWVPARDRHIGYVPQDLALFPHLDVSQNIRYGQQRDHNPAFSFESICHHLDIEKNLRQYPNALSGGEKQRVAFARALIAQPALLLLDEPLNGLDHELKQRVIRLLLNIRREYSMPMLYVTHSPAEIMALCHDVILLNNGQITGRGKPSDLFIATDTPVFRLKPEMDPQS